MRRKRSSLALRSQILRLLRNPNRSGIYERHFKTAPSLGSVIGYAQTACRQDLEAVHHGTDIVMKTILPGLILLSLACHAWGAATTSGEAAKVETHCALTAQYDPGNPFAQKLRGELPSSIVYEDDHVLAFLDDFDQKTPGHVIVIPKRSVRNLLDMTPEEMAQVLAVARRVAIAMQRALGATGFRVQHNNGSGGQTVCHAHFHVLPTFDGPANASNPAYARDRSNLDAMAARLRAELPPG